MSEIYIAPLVSAHDGSGRKPFDGYWSYSTPHRARKWRAKEIQRGAIEREFVPLLNAVRNSRWSEEVKHALALYFDAFSQPNLEESFLGGWRLLEFIGGFSESTHERVGERAAAMFESSSEMFQVAQHLRLRRNAISHGGKVNAHDDEVLTYQVHYLLVPLFSIFIVNHFDFRSVNELWRFLDLAFNEDEAGSLRRLLDALEQFKIL